MPTNQRTIEIETAPGVWTDISGDVYERSPIIIARGKSDEQSLAQAQRLTFTLENRDGKYSPRNPLSTLYGSIGRNIPVRCKIDSGAFTRFYGYIPDIAPRWNEKHSDNFIEVEAYGILRRLSQGQPVISNALRDYVLSQSTLVAYYPLSGGEGTIYSQNLAPGAVGSFRGSKNAIFTYGKDMGNAPWLDTGMELNATGDVPYMEGRVNSKTTNVALDFVFQSPAFGVLDVELWPSMDQYYRLRLNTSADAGTALVTYFNDKDGLVSGSVTAVIPELDDTELHTCRFELDTIAGPNTQYSVYIDGALLTSGTTGLGYSMYWLPMFRFHYSRFVSQTVMNMAHLTVWADNTAANMPTAQEYTDAAFAYTGETAIDRMERICADGDIPLTAVGTAADSMPMGPQFAETRQESLLECANTDLGILFETRNSPGLTYVSRSALYNQTAQFTLAYSNGHVAPPLEPVDDDSNLRNDVTASRREAGSDRFTVDTGALSTLDPPTGVGRYNTDVTVNPVTDGYLYGIAAWLANIGTLDRARWPSVTVNLASSNISGALENLIKAAEVGDLFTITGLTRAFVYDDVPLIIVGYTETITRVTHTITFNCMAADPYTVSLYNTARYDADRSTVTSNVTSGATSLSATKSGTTLWTTDGTQMPFDILVGGERMRVTAVSGSSSPQTLTVTRAINGVVKAQTAGTAIELWDTPRYAL